jgi:hypothetical protein
MYLSLLIISSTPNEVFDLNEDITVGLESLGITDLI